MYTWGSCGKNCSLGLGNEKNISIMSYHLTYSYSEVYPFDSASRDRQNQRCSILHVVLTNQNGLKLSLEFNTQVVIQQRMRSSNGETSRTWWPTSSCNSRDLVRSCEHTCWPAQLYLSIPCLITLELFLGNRNLTHSPTLGKPFMLPVFQIHCVFVSASRTTLAANSTADDPLAGCKLLAVKFCVDTYSSINCDFEVSGSPQSKALISPRPFNYCLLKKPSSSTSIY